MKSILSLIFLSLLSTTITLAAETPSRWIDLEWNEVPGATSYDLSLYEIIDNKEYPRGVFHTDTPHWSKEVPPGKYNAKIRALDNRKVPGSWGEAIPIVIKLIPPQLIKPLQNETIVISDSIDASSNFQWSQVNGAKLYQVVVLNSQNKIILNEITKETEIKASMNQIDSYKWYIFPLFTLEEKKNINDFIFNTDELKIFKNFSVLGSALKSPSIETEIVPGKGLVLRWKEVLRAENYSYELFKEEVNKTYTKINSAILNKNVIAIGKDKTPNGRYMVSIKSQAKKYRESEASKILFQNESNNLEIISNESFNQESLARPVDAKSLRGQFGYPTFKYTSKNYETDTQNEETLRGIEMKAIWKKNILENKYQNLLSFELAQIADSYVDANYWSFADDIGKVIHLKQYRILLAGGLRLDSTPFIYADRFNNKVNAKNNLTLSPEVYSNISYNFNKNWNNEFKFYLNTPLIGFGSKPKINLNLELEYRLIYTMTNQFDIYSGLSYISKTIKTPAEIGINSFAFPGDINEITLKSAYLFFGFEFFY